MDQQTPGGHNEHHELNFINKTAVFLGVTVPFAGVIAAMILLWGRGFSWLDLGLLVGMYSLTVIGITVGYHRLFTHTALRDQPRREGAAGDPRLDGVARAGAQVGAPCTAATTSTPTATATRTPRTTMATGIWRHAQGHVARAHRLGLRRRPAGPVAVRQRPAARPRWSASIEQDLSSSGSSSACSSRRRSAGW